MNLLVEGAAVEAAQGRECSHPYCCKCVKMCIHFENKWVRLVEYGEPLYCVSHATGDPAMDKDSLCVRCGEVIGTYSWAQGGHIYDGSDYPSALAAFRKAEAELLGRPLED